MPLFQRIVSLTSCQFVPKYSFSNRSQSKNFNKKFAMNINFLLRCLWFYFSDSGSELNVIAVAYYEKLLEVFVLIVEWVTYSSLVRLKYEHIIIFRNPIYPTCFLKILNMLHVLSLFVRLFNYFSVMYF